jgi:proteic killer suppression protein
MIKSIRDKDTQKVMDDIKPKKFSKELCRIARRKLRMVDSAEELLDLRVPPKNCLEALKGDRKGQHSIRINVQWRICFRWENGNSFDVEITDYH